MAQQIYRIPLLNDIHNWFPDILYNPQRFRTIQDFLEYIRQVATTSPYAQGYQQYISRQQRGIPVDPLATVATAAGPQRSTRPLHPDRHIGSILESALHGASPGIATETTYEYTTYMGGANGSSAASGASVPITTRVRTLPITASILETDELEPAMGHAISYLLNQIASSNPIMQNFLDQRVVVTPTRQEIDRASVLEQCRSVSEDICTICQDTFQVDQPIRRLTHCTHAFHKTCVDVWFQTNVHCPMCRHDIRQTNRVPPPVPATRQELDRASILVNYTSPSDEICIICQDAFRADPPVRLLTHCNHAFHKRCADVWFQTNVHCPVCRHDIRQTNRAPPVPDHHRITNIHDTTE